VFLFRCSAIARLERKPAGLFDERMWMYKEDIDLAYRLRWLDEKIAIFPEVWGWHARTVANREGQGLAAMTKADKDKRAYARFHSYKNHFLLLKNNFTWSYGPAIRLKVLGYEFMKGVYMLFRSPKTFLAGLATLIFVRGRRSSRRVSAQKMLSYFD
jgi:GT2 family glycosyltransferase